VADQTDVIEKVIEVIKTIDLSPFGIRQDAVYELDFPFHDRPPAAGIVVSRVKEEELSKLNNRLDLLYPVQVMRVGFTLDNRGGVRRSAWREAVWRRFTHTRIGIVGEMKTQARHMEIQLDATWKTWNLDASGLRIETLIRKQ